MALMKLAAAPAVQFGALAMPVNLPSLSEQFAAALSALVPFSLAVLVVGIVVWRVFEWCYRAVIEKTKSLYELSQTAAQIAQQVAADKEGKLSATVADLNKKIEELTARLQQQANQLPADLVPALKQLNQTSTLANTQIKELKQANSNVADILNVVWSQGSAVEAMKRAIARGSTLQKAKSDE